MGPREGISVISTEVCIMAQRDPAPAAQNTAGVQVSEVAAQQIQTRKNCRRFQIIRSSESSRRKTNIPLHIKYDLVHIYHVSATVNHLQFDTIVNCLAKLLRSRAAKRRQSLV